MSNRKKILVVGMKWPHMGGSSGLAPLSLALERYADVTRVAVGRRERAEVLAARIARKVGLKGIWSPAESFSPYHDWQKATVEKAAMRAARSASFDVVLFEAVEDCFARFGHIKPRLGQTKLVGITHHPPAWWRMMVRYANRLQVFDHIVGLSQGAKAELTSLLPQVPNTFLRHGVAFDFFTPSPAGHRTLSPGETVDIVFCGQWLRDFKRLEKFVEASQGASGWSFRFHLVVPPAGRKIDSHYRLAMYDNVKWHAGLSDEGLRDLYRRSHLLLLPLIDATANNALLEAAACQLPILVSNVGGTPDYLDETTATFISDRAPLDQLMDCVENYEQCQTKAAAARRRVVETCNWDLFARSLLGELGWHVE